LFQIQQVVDILRTTELYSPQLKDDKGKPGDPVTNDLIGALLSVIKQASNNSINNELYFGFN
jgi:hypothetical protein